MKTYNRGISKILAINILVTTIYIFASCSSKNDTSRRLKNDLPKSKSGCLTYPEDADIVKKDMVSKYFDGLKKPILTLNENHEAEKLLSSPFRNTSIMRLHSVTGGINFGNNFGPAELRTGQPEQNSSLGNPLSNCIRVENNQAVIYGEFYITLPCNSLGMINNLSLIHI